MATHSSTLAWKIPLMEEPGRLQIHGVAKSWTGQSDFTQAFSACFNTGMFVVVTVVISLSPEYYSQLLNQPPCFK